MTPAFNPVPTPKRVRLPRNIWVLGGVSFLNDSASEMIYCVFHAKLTHRSTRS